MESLTIGITETPISWAEVTGATTVVIIGQVDPELQTKRFTLQTVACHPCSHHLHLLGEKGEVVVFSVAVRRRVAALPPKWNSEVWIGSKGNVGVAVSSL